MAAKTPRKTRPPKKVESNGPPPIPDGEIMTLAEAAKFLRVSDEGLKADAISGKVPARIVAGEWRFSRAGLLLWLGQSELAPTSAKLTGRELVEHIRKSGIPWSTESEREAESFIASTKSYSISE